MPQPADEIRRNLPESCDENAVGRRRYDPSVHLHLQPILRES